jgi:hypothetical protein
MLQTVTAARIRPAMACAGQVPQVAGDLASYEVVASASALSLASAASNTAYSAS